MQIDNIEITVREVIFSVTIASVLFLIGFLASSAIEHNVNQRNLEYRQAAQIANTNEFALALKTDVGNAFVEGDFFAVDVVRHPKLRGEWASIRADHQKYTRHTRTVHYTVRDSEGRSHTRTRTEHYWTWDTYKVNSWRSKTVNFCGMDFAFDKFEYPWRCKYRTIVSDGWHRRIVFDCIPAQFHASAYTKLAGGTISNKTALNRDVPIPALYENYTRSCAVTIFWWIWGILMVAAVIAFVAIDNRWLEDGRRMIRNDYMKRWMRRKRTEVEP